MEKKLTINLNGMDISELPTKLSTSNNLIKEYQILISGILIAISIIFHAWISIILKTNPVNFTIKHNQTINRPTEIRTMIKTLEPPPPTWLDRLVKKAVK